MSTVTARPWHSSTGAAVTVVLTWLLFTGLVCVEATVAVFVRAHVTRDLV